MYFQSPVLVKTTTIVGIPFIMLNYSYNYNTFYKQGLLLLQIPWQIHLDVLENYRNPDIYMKSSDAKASKCHLKFSYLMMIFIKLVYLSSVISLKWQ